MRNRLTLSGAAVALVLGAVSMPQLVGVHAQSGATQAVTAPQSTATQDTAAASAPMMPFWAYPVMPRAPRPAGAPPAGPRPAPDNTPRSVPGSSATYTTAQVADLFAVPDWYPEDHPKMPAPVAQGRRPDAAACGYCHLPNGLGRPENQSIAGLPRDYILQQLKDFKEGSRKSTNPNMGSVAFMTRVARAITPEEAEEAATYISGLKLTKWIRVVETDTVPKTHGAGGMLVAEAEGTEPIGSRVVEVSENLELTELRSDRSGFIAYVPKGSIKTGETLVKTGAGKTAACTTCHGANLKGMGNVPGIAGRSPSQMARQLYDFRSGARNGAGAALMKMPASSLTDDDIVAVTAYLASLNP